MLAKTMKELAEAQATLKAVNDKRAWSVTARSFCTPIFASFLENVILQLDSAYPFNPISP